MIGICLIGVYIGINLWFLPYIKYKNHMKIEQADLDNIESLPDFYQMDILF